MKDEIEVEVEVEANGKGGDGGLYNLDQGGKGGTPDFYLYGHKIVQKDGDGKGGN